MSAFTRQPPPRQTPSTAPGALALDAASRRPDCWRRSAGFTLIELMIAVAIVAILASVALPAYSDYVRRGQLPEAFSALSDFRIKMEQYYQDNRNYGGAACADVAAGPSWAGFAPTGATHFGYACALLNAGQGYRVTATGNAGVAAVGHAYTIDHSNNQTTTAFKGAAVNKTCWVSRGTEC